MAYVHGFVDRFNKDTNGARSESEITWIDYLVSSNPEGVMKVLADNGYNGYLAPQDEDELIDAIYNFIDKNGDEGIILLLKSHPLYHVIAESCKEETQFNAGFKNASGEQSSFITSISSINYKKVIETILIIIGSYYLANLIWNKTFKDTI